MSTRDAPSPLPAAAGDEPLSTAGAAAVAAADRIDQLAFLHELAQLATQARDWDELMRTLVDRTTVALGVEVCSFYLLDRDGERLTLAATNGLDPDQVGRVSLALGEGLTGRAADSRTPVHSTDVTVDPRFSWVRGFDIHGLHAMLSVPLVWNEAVVGVLNVQTTDVREFTREDAELLSTIAALLAGIVEKGRMQAEAEAQLDRLSQLDAARAELLAVVTHELRTPLAVVRAYVDLLADAAASNAAGPTIDAVENWRAGATDQVTRLDRLVDSILASVRGEGLTGLRRDPFDVVGSITNTVGTLALLLRTRAVRWDAPGYAMVARGDEPRFRQVLEHLLDNEAKYAPPEQAVSIGVWRTADEIEVYITDDGPGVPIEDWEVVFQPYVRVDRARSRGSGIGLFAARRLMEAMGGRVWIEKNGYGGSRFMVALPVA
ncbi:MAG TPA: ATP-binding protein [Candidatus Limnocylindrales bacterium]|nr:ATP-binding protein [Candidatus Limnocylindrales bacterium]